ncbi:MAG: prepilin-type N-terminal cleavage/methylation domain-containing protein [Endomicrobia bacterium]|nr:prepilin-type N-terminal cleavage/methylation domain-containing protein [Endomicrobiia bacterium]
MKKGFTLIEAIITIAIIVVLAGIAVPQVEKQLVKAKKNSDIYSAKTIAFAIREHIEDGNILLDASKKEIDFNDEINFPWVKNIENAKDMKPKMDKNYKFFYSYSTTTDEIKVLAGPEISKVKQLYPVVDETDDYAPNM